MLVLFLDIDGVINSEESYRVREEYHQKYNKWISPLDEEVIKRIAKIVSITGAKVVLSSTRRFDWKDGKENLEIDESKYLQSLFDKYGIEIIGITPKIAKSNDPKENYTSWREYEINSYLNTHPEIEGFCIIDDEKTDLHSLEGNLIKINPNYGLTDEGVEQAIQILITQKKERSKLSF